MLGFFGIIFVIAFIIFIIFVSSIKNIICYILESLGIDRRTISFIFSIIIVILIGSLFF